MKYRVLFCAFILLILPAMASAGEKERLAEELMVLTQMDKISVQIQNQLSRNLDETMKQFKIPDHQKVRAVEFHKRMNKMILDEVSWDRMKQDYVKLFAEVYSTDELREIVTFHKSPIGQVMIEKQPVLIEKSMMMSQKKMKGLIPKMENMLDEFVKTL